VLALEFAPNRLSIWPRTYRDRQQREITEMENGKWTMETGEPIARKFDDPALFAFRPEGA